MVYGITIPSSKEIEEEINIKDRINNLLFDFEEVGYGFLPAWTMDKPCTPDRVQLPSGKIIDEFELEEYFRNRRLITGDREQIEVLGAREFYFLVRAIDSDYRHERYPQSFVDEEDIEDCRRKYK